MFGVDDYYDDLLLEAKTPEEIKKILDYQFVKSKGVPQQVLDAVFAMDPTKKKTYTRWVLNQVDEYGGQITKAIEDGSLKRMFDTFKERAAEGLDLTNIKNFEEAMKYIPEIDPVLTKDGDPDAPENQFDIMYESPEWVVAVPHTYEADKKLGQGCKWCTAGAYGDNDGYWKRYSSAGPLWVNFDKTKKEVGPRDGKEYPYKRYQLLFEWNNWCGELMDAHDYRVDVSNIGMPEEVIEFYGEQNEKYKEILENGAEDEEAAAQRYYEDRWECVRVVINLNDNYYLSLLPEENDDHNLDVDYYLYDEEDTSDPIDYQHSFGRADYNYFKCRSENERAAILIDDEGREVLVWCEEHDNGRWRSHEFKTAELDKSVAYDDFAAGIMRRGDELMFMPLSYSVDDIGFFSCPVSDYGFEADSLFYNEQVSTVIDQAGHYGWAIEVIGVDGSHSLLLCTDYGIEPLIRKDYPAEDKFVATIEGDNVVISARKRKYSFGEDMEPSSDNFQLYKDLGEHNGEEYAIVITGDMGPREGKYYNLYNETRNKFVFDKNFTGMDIFGDYDDILIVSDNGDVFLYGLSQKRMLTAKHSSIFDYAVKSGHFNFRGRYYVGKGLGEGKGNTNDVIYEVVDGVFRKIVETKYTGMFCVSLEGEPYCTIKDGNSYNFMNLLNGNLTFENSPVKKYGFIEDSDLVLISTGVISNLNTGDTDKFSLANFVTGNIVLDNVNFKQNHDTKPRTLIGGWIKAQTRDGKWHLLNAKTGKDLTPKGAFEIENITYNNWCVIGMDGKVFLMDKNLNFWPSKNGIDLKNSNISYQGVGNRRIFLHYKNKLLFSVVFDNNDQPSLEFNSNYNGCDDYEQMCQEIRQLVLSEAHQVSENFRRIYKSITELRR